MGGLRRQVHAADSRETNSRKPLTLADESRRTGFYVRHAATATGDKTIQQVIDELLAVKNAAGMSPRYLQDLRLRLNVFVRTFGSENAINVSQQMVDDWIVALPWSGTTKNNYRRLLGVMFSFAVDRKYILAVPISKQSKATVKRGKPGILPVEECARLLSWRPRIAATMHRCGSWKCLTT
jgi:hypothetical protein